MPFLATIECFHPHLAIQKEEQKLRRHDSRPASAINELNMTIELFSPSIFTYKKFNQSAFTLASMQTINSRYRDTREYHHNDKH